jgi:hypothetical protein
MSNICTNINDKNEKCTKRCILPHTICTFHRSQGSIPKPKSTVLQVSNKEISSSNNTTPPIDNNDNNDSNDNIPQPINTNTDINNNDAGECGDCAICLCEIEKDDKDTGLVCGHRFHVDCLNQVEKAECPVCRAPLSFLDSKNSTVDINKIKIKEQEEFENNKLRQIEADAEFSRRLQNRGNRANNGHGIIIDMGQMLQMMNEIHMMGEIIDGNNRNGNNNNPGNHHDRNHNHNRNDHHINPFEFLAMIDDHHNIEEEQIARAIANSLAGDR